MTAHTDTAVLLIELGAIVVGLATLGRLAHRFGFSTIPLYLVAGLAFGNGGLLPVQASHAFVQVGSEIGVLLLLFMLGLESSGDTLASEVKSAAPAGLVDLVLNALPGFACGLLLGWSAPEAALLGAMTWVSSSGVAARVIGEAGRGRNAETPLVVAILVIEDLAMAVALPLASWALAGGRGGPAALITTLAVVAVVVAMAARSSPLLSRLVNHGSDEVVLFTALGLMLLVAGLAQRLQISAAVGAFVVGLSLSGPVAQRAHGLLGPLRDLFAAMFFLFFGLQIDPAGLVPVLLPAGLLAAAGAATKLATGAFAARRAGLDAAAGWRAGAALIARGEFSIVLAGLGLAAGLRSELGSLAAAFVLATAILGPLLARWQGPRAVGARP